MELKIVEERELKPLNGFLMLAVMILGSLLSIAAMVVAIVILAAEEGSSDPSNSILSALLLVVGFLAWVGFSIGFCGLKVVHPNEAKVFTLFGKYYGTIKEAGFYHINPFCTVVRTKRPPAKSAAKTQAVPDEGTGSVAILTATVSAGPSAVSLKVQTLDNGLQKVNDVLGNPIIIGAMVIWRVVQPTQAVFSVENYYEYLGIQTDSTIRNTARLYPYDVFDESDNGGVGHEKTLRGSSLEIADTMKAELQKRACAAGLEIEEVRITHLAYSEEIAAAMLQRQQAEAIIAARQKIVDGAVGMVEGAVGQLSANQLIVLDDERKAAMVSNLLVVLVGNRDAQPIVNAGSIY
ncbi:MAG: SPFH domain-containing protein [Actinomycetia bacterium]|nr:SPFH domain-containing protein [Actinomycetes bacterium]